MNYGVAEQLDGNVTFKYTLLQKDESGDMLGTAHQSLVYMPETDKCYIAYHRFYTPLGIYTDGLGFHRETCIDEVTFDAEGLMKPLKPTMEGVTLKDHSSDKKQEDQKKLDSIAEKADFREVFQGGTINSAGKLTLPSVLGDAAVSWKTSNPAVIAADGTITLPKEDTTVTMTATFTYGEATVTKTFQVVVKAAASSSSDAAIYPNKVTLNVKAGITLGLKEKVQLKATVSPKQAEQKVTWKSSKPVTEPFTATVPFLEEESARLAAPVSSSNFKFSTEVSVFSAPSAEISAGAACRYVTGRLVTVIAAASITDHMLLFLIKLSSLSFTYAFYPN